MRIDELARILNLRYGDIVDHAQYYLSKIESQGDLKGKPLEAKVALCLFVSARANKKPKPLCEILRYVSATQSHVNACLKRTMKTIFSHVDFRLQPSDIIDKTIFKANLPEEIRQPAKDLSEKLKPLMEGKPPRTIAGVALFFVTRSLRKQDRGILGRIAETVDVAEKTITRNASAVDKLLR